MGRRIARRLHITGTVQGVGFRPFVLRLARRHGVTGWVRNHAAGVEIHVEADPATLEMFSAALVAHAPPSATIAGIRAEPADPEAFRSFEILESDQGGRPATRISPDLGVCDDCLRELRDPSDRRAGYPYINCTNCGPRYSIIRSLPYDRSRTTMARWSMCDDCRREYTNPTDRRYHAQPVACPACGPTYRLVSDGREIAGGADAVTRAAERLASGGILAIKGIGGYHLACDASNADAVRLLRARKFRKEKPFAVMVSTIESGRSLISLDPAHEALLTSVARPIVLARALRQLPHVAPDNDELGVMLPYAPLHHMLFAAGAPDPLVLTSANRSNEPIAYDDDDALRRLAGLADAFLIGERSIQRRIDDSVVAVRDGGPFVIRRARGFAPASVGTIDTDRPILAVGADLKNAIALGVRGEVFVSQHIGDLGDVDTERAFRETIDDLLTMYAVDRRQLIIAHDMHPEYFSTRTALSLDAAEHVTAQHHEAHIAAIMLEHACVDEDVVGIALDGTGYGRDGTIWGGEILAGSIARGFTRSASLEPVAMPGGDAAARHPVQAAAAYLPDLDPELVEAAPLAFPTRFRHAQQMVRRGVRTVTTTSAGRLFDAAAAVCGFTRENAFEGQGAMWLEHRAARGSPDVLDLAPTLDPSLMIRTMLAARLDGAEAPDLAAWFHASLARTLRQTAVGVANDLGCNTIALSGGVWQNRRLLDAFLAGGDDGMRVLWGRQVPVNDGGICVGQIAIAARTASTMRRPASTPRP